jgi:serine/threonine protein kinase
MDERNTLDRFDRAEELFLNSLEFKDAAQREIYLQQACKGDAGLQVEVRTMLDRFPEASAFFRTASHHLSVPSGLPVEGRLEAGTVVGPYRILSLLGEGGSSRVYEAEQETPVRRKVAIKILKLGMDTAAVIRRFEAERQTLAMLEHPNISRVFDAGATSTGRPYFVMELVHGMRITDYCAKNNLPVDDRLRLMCQVCAALQHAHNKGIIHRDIKPSNILVPVVDGVPIPKLIDFGIAKATDTPSDDGKTLQNFPMGTPAYMSPEQFGGGPKDIDTRSDIYSLGVVLYELLAGKPPFDNDKLIHDGFDEMRRRIQNEEPQRPSRLRMDSVASSRNELDWIVMKALAKDRERRYSTAHAFAGDMESYLRNEPVKAHPPSRLYRFKKLVRRNRIASASISIAVVALAAGFTFSTFLYLRAHAAEQEQSRLREAAEEKAHITKAAILIMEDRVADADAEIRRMGGALTQPSVEAMNVFRTMAIWSAKNGDWKTSADRWLAMANVSRFDDRDMTDKVTRDLLPVAPTLVMTCDFKRYGEFQNFLLGRLGKTSYPFAAEHLLKLCLLTPASPALLVQLQHAATVAERSMPGTAMTTPTDWMEAWRCVALGLWYYRNGSPDKAIQWCNRSLLRHDWEEARAAQALLIRSMSRKATGDIDGAMNDLDIARASVKAHFQQPLDEMKDGYFHDWLNALILKNEAERVVLDAR